MLRWKSLRWLICGCLITFFLGTLILPLPIPSHIFILPSPPSPSPSPPLRDIKTSSSWNVEYKRLHETLLARAARDDLDGVRFLIVSIEDKDAIERTFIRLASSLLFSAFTKRALIIDESSYQQQQNSMKEWLARDFLASSHPSSLQNSLEGEFLVIGTEKEEEVVNLQQFLSTNDFEELFSSQRLLRVGGDVFSSPQHLEWLLQNPIYSSAISQMTNRDDCRGDDRKRAILGQLLGTLLSASSSSYSSKFQQLMSHLGNLLDTEEKASAPLFGCIYLRSPSSFSDSVGFTTTRYLGNQLSALRDQGGVPIKWVVFPPGTENEETTTQRPYVVGVIERVLENKDEEKEHEGDRDAFFMSFNRILEGEVGSQKERVKMAVLFQCSFLIHDLDSSQPIILLSSVLSPVCPTIISCSTQMCSPSPSSSSSPSPSPSPSPPPPPPPPPPPTPLGTSSKHLPYLQANGVVVTEIREEYNGFSILKLKLRYPNFELPRPRFVSNEHEASVGNHPRIKEWVGETQTYFEKHTEQQKRDDVFLFHGNTYTYGEVIVVNNTTITMPFDCSPDGDYHSLFALLPVPVDSTIPAFKRLTYLKVAQAWSFQHFMDGALPRVSQGWDYIGLEDTTVITNPITERFPIVRLLWQRMGKYPVVRGEEREGGVKEEGQGSVKRANLIGMELGDVYFAEEMVVSCIQPWHPLIWRRGPKEVLGVTSLPYSQRDRIIYVSRSRGKGAFNGGRQITNEEDLIRGIRDWLKEKGRSEELAFADEGPSPENTQEMFDFWKRAKVIIGPHGGGLYNLNWTGEDTIIIEVSPLRSSLGSLWIFYMMSAALGQRYYHLPYPPDNSNMVVDINHVLSILESQL
jgi:hypothetical protein